MDNIAHIKMLYYTFLKQTFHIHQIRDLIIELRIEIEKLESQKVILQIHDTITQLKNQIVDLEHKIEDIDLLFGNF